MVFLKPVVEKWDVQRIQFLNWWLYRISGRHQQYYKGNSWKFLTITSCIGNDPPQQLVRRWLAGFLPSTTYFDTPHMPVRNPSPLILRHLDIDRNNVPSVDDSVACSPNRTHAMDERLPWFGVNLFLRVELEYTHWNCTLGYIVIWNWNWIQQRNTCDTGWEMKHEWTFIFVFTVENMHPPIFVLTGHGH